MRLAQTYRICGDCYVVRGKRRTSLAGETAAERAHAAALVALLTGGS